ncbi:UNVERIFIED_CONTAM: hypothetical protein FKN15_052300 [Acipenser sinensis]
MAPPGCGGELPSHPPPVAVALVPPLLPGIGLWLWFHLFFLVLGGADGHGVPKLPTTRAPLVHHVSRADVPWWQLSLLPPLLLFFAALPSHPSLHPPLLHTQKTEKTKSCSTSSGLSPGGAGDPTLDTTCGSDDGAVTSGQSAGTKTTQGRTAGGTAYCSLHGKQPQPGSEHHLWQQAQPAVPGFEAAGPRDHLQDLAVLAGANSLFGQ